jgi:hypothetical protein
MTPGAVVRSLLHLQSGSQHQTPLPPEAKSLVRRRPPVVRACKHLRRGPETRALASPALASTRVVLQSGSRDRPWSVSCASDDN